MRSSDPFDHGADETLGTPISHIQPKTTLSFRNHRIERLAYATHIKMVVPMQINVSVEQRGDERERHLVKHMQCGTDFLICPPMCDVFHAATTLL